MNPLINKQGEYHIKNLDLVIEDVDTGGRMVKGYLSAFNVKDADKDIILPGAFKQSINLRGPESPSKSRKIAYLRNHDWDHQIGRFTELKEDSTGLLFVAKMGTSTKGEDALRDYDEGILREHSIGFKYVRDRIEYNEEEDTFYVKEVTLWEGSAVTFGANEMTPVLEVQKMLKGEGAEFAIQKLNDEISIVQKSLKNGLGSDERLYSLEMRLKVFQTKMNELLACLSSEAGIDKPIVSEKERLKAIEAQKKEDAKKASFVLLQYL